MGQMTIYLDPETEQKLKAFLEGSNISKSKWIASLIREQTSREWPEKIKRLAGAWNDFPEAEELRKDLAPDFFREPL
ncbi:conserved hypothetical protein [Desulfonatronospira thiodismutans ASO3-1]|uniref:CopG family transcriptional regulator n=1 Tax=Desulfonatronospira thiodismutans ASO3-1 TaxID=555779 RepID=D6SR66_9BACT|nr:hypothetical protein [Desulfonatronospira thiodismutans]EFI33182.1 conserved hypothetical protein [Desulfonatronospira thiodismutans ASO3-1]